MVCIQNVYMSIIVEIHDRYIFCLYVFYMYDM